MRFTAALLAATALAAIGAGTAQADDGPDPT
ncbi:hypothetical protein EDD93_7838 [Streptomyces sp. 840.1]|nr:hypothetical protein EDD93_7838 [Streptomyces sp. 840.1]